MCNWILWKDAFSLIVVKEFSIRLDLKLFFSDVLLQDSYEIILQTKRPTCQRRIFLRIRILQKTYEIPLDQRSLKIIRPRKRSSKCNSCSPWRIATRSICDNVNKGSYNSPKKTTKSSKVGASISNKIHNLIMC